MVTKKTIKPKKLGRPYGTKTMDPRDKAVIITLSIHQPVLKQLDEYIYKKYGKDAKTKSRSAIIESFIKEKTE